MSEDFPQTEPSPEDFPSIRAFSRAYEAFHNSRRPTDAQTLERAVRIASECMRGIDMQIRRIRGSEPEDTEWQLRVLTDFQVLVVLLWRLRMAGLMLPTKDIRAAVGVFDQSVPDLKLMRNVSQHLDEYAVDGSGRRQKPPGGTKPVSRRRLENYSWSEGQFAWLGGTINVEQARSAAVRLYNAIRDRREAEGAPSC